MEYLTPALIGGGTPKNSVRYFNSGWRTVPSSKTLLLHLLYFSRHMEGSDSSTGLTGASCRRLLSVPLVGTYSAGCLAIS